MSDIERGKLFARQHQDGVSLVVGVDFEAREEMMSAAPEKFYITDHYLNYPWMLVRVSKIRPGEFRDLLIEAWRRAAPNTWSARLVTFDHAELVLLMYRDTDAG